MKLSEINEMYLKQNKYSPKSRGFPGASLGSPRVPFKGSIDPWLGNIGREPRGMQRNPSVPQNPSWVTHP